MELDAAEVADLLRASASILWVIVAVIALVVFRRVVADGGPLSKLGLGPSGVTMEFAERKLQEAADRLTSVDETADSAEASPPAAIGVAAQRTILRRIQRSTDLLDGATILWVDDHPENNQAIADLLRHYGAVIDTAPTNRAAVRLLGSARYDVVVSDVARDFEGPDGNLKGVELADYVFKHSGQKIVLFTGRFSPLTMPGMSSDERLELAKLVDSAVFGVTYRFDDAIHLILDVLERLR